MEIMSKGGDELVIKREETVKKRNFNEIENEGDDENTRNARILMVREEDVNKRVKVQLCEKEDDMSMGKSVKRTNDEEMVLPCEKDEKRVKADNDRRGRGVETKRLKHEEIEEKHRPKESAKLLADEEKGKKARSQLRLNVFFGGRQKSSTCDDINNSTVANATIIHEDCSPMSEAVPCVSDYSKFFLAYCIPSFTVIAPENALLPDEPELSMSRQRLDDLMAANGECTSGTESCLEWNTWTEHVKLRRRTVSVALDPMVQDLLQQINKVATKPGLNDTKVLINRLACIPLKCIQFQQDIRPPYYGTYTRVQDEKVALKLSRNPFTKCLPATNYDYDSEVEWDEVEEGEDIGSDGNDEGDSIAGGEDEDDLRGFLDDDCVDNEVAIGRNKQNLFGELVPITTGVCWQDAQGASYNVEGEEVDFSEYEVKFLIDFHGHQASIDPYSSVYWKAEGITGAELSSKNEPSGGLGITGNGQTSAAHPLGSALEASTVPKPPKRWVPAESMEEFKKEIQGSDLTKIALIEALKKRFPSIPKDAIVHTLSSIAERVGSKASGKRWTIKQSG